MQFDSWYQINIVLPKNYVNDTIVKFTLQGIAIGVKIRAPSDEDMDTLPVYEITSLLFWEPTRKLTAENEVAVHEGVGISKRQRIFMGREEQKEGETWRVNILTTWEEYTDNTLMTILHLYDSSIS